VLARQWKGERQDALLAGAGPNPSMVGGSPEQRSHIGFREYRCRNWRCPVSYCIKVAIASVSDGLQSECKAASSSELLIVMNSGEIIPRRDRCMDGAMAGIEWNCEYSIRFRRSHRYR
jgi:hypothetical protein